MGMPIISVVEGNFNGNGELLLTHLFEGVEMQPDYMKATMENIYAIWKKPVHLATVMDGEGRIYSWDGQEFKNAALNEINEEKSGDTEEPSEKKDED
jgi:stage V sporulation protein R